MTKNPQPGEHWGYRIKTELAEPLQDVEVLQYGPRLPAKRSASAPLMANTRDWMSGFHRAGWSYLEKKRPPLWPMSSGCAPRGMSWEESLKNRL